ncbi:MAG: bacillithiol transferase BstA [Acidobacteriaceae bacterium]|nr:bacillithiol transferase BstA [Acidobacteriaceae bacterium]
MNTNQNLRYPLGKYQPPEKISSEQRTEWIDTIAALPRELKQAVSHLTESQLDTPYRPGGWTVRQVVHHLPDSHLNSYIRFRFALTEDTPTIKPYDEAKWAELPDAKTGPIGSSLLILEGLHERWTALLRTLDDAAFARTLRHPEWGEIRLDWTLGLYAWHCRHHLAHIQRAFNGAH